MSTSAASPPAPTTRTSDYIAIKRQLGKGHNAVVYLVDYNTDPIPRAMKKIARNNKRTENLNKLRANNPARSQGPGLPRTSTGPSALVDRRGTEEAKIRREIAIMKKCDHPNIIKFFSFIDDQMSANVCLIMEYMAGGELQWQTPSGGPYLAMGQTRRCTRDVVLGLQYLHLQGIIHRDIKPSNIMWTADRSHVKIGDFGVAHLVSPSPSSKGKNGDEGEGEEEESIARHAGTPAFLAPEIAPGAPMPSFSASSLSSTPSSSSKAASPVTPAVDLWALGVTLFCMLFGRMPFEPAPEAQGAGPVAAEASLYRAIRSEGWREKVPGLVPVRSNGEGGEGEGAEVGKGGEGRGGEAVMCANRVPIFRPYGPAAKGKGEKEKDEKVERKSREALNRSSSLKGLVRKGSLGRKASLGKRKASVETPPDVPSREKGAGEGGEGASAEDEEELYRSGEGVLDLLGGLLEKDVRKRWGIGEVKDVPWLLYDIQRRAEWRKATTPRISVSAADEANAILEPKFKWNLKTRLGRRFSNFNFFRSGRTDAEREKERETREKERERDRARRTRGRRRGDEEEAGIRSAPNMEMWRRVGRDKEPRGKGKEKEHKGKDKDKEKPTKRKTKPKSRSVDTARLPPLQHVPSQRRGSDTESMHTMPLPQSATSTTPSSSSAAGDSPTVTRRARGFFRWGRESPAPSVPSTISTPTTSMYPALGASTFTPTGTGTTTATATTYATPPPAATAKRRLGVFPPSAARHSTDALSPRQPTGAVVAAKRRLGIFPRAARHSVEALGGAGLGSEQRTTSMIMTTALAGSGGEGYWSAEGEGDGDVDADLEGGEGKDGGLSMMGRGMIVGAIVPPGGYARDEEGGVGSVGSVGSPSGSGSVCSYGSGARAREVGVGVGMGKEAERDVYGDEEEEERDPYVEEEYYDDEEDDGRPRGDIYDSTSSGDEENVPITFKGARRRIPMPGPGNGQSMDHDRQPQPPPPPPPESDDDEESDGVEVLRIPNHGPGQ